MFSAPLLISIIFIPVIVSLGITTSLEDAVSFRIRNRLVFAGIFYSLFVYIICFIFSTCGVLPGLPSDLRIAVEYLFNDTFRWAATALVSFTVGYAFWKMNLWGGGDAKLFLCYAMLTPVGVYHYVYFKGFFPSFLHLQLTFIPATIYLIIKAGLFHLPKLKEITFERCVSAVKQKIAMNLSPRYLWGSLRVASGFIVFLLLGMIIFRNLRGNLFSFGLGGNIAFLISLLCYRWLTLVFKQRKWTLVILYLLLAISVAVNPKLLFDIFKQLPKAVILTILIGYIAPFLYELIDAYAEQAKEKYSAMAVWMFIATCIIWLW